MSNETSVSIRFDCGCEIRLLYVHEVSDVSRKLGWRWLWEPRKQDTCIQHRGAEIAHVRDDLSEHVKNMLLEMGRVEKEQ